MNSKKIKDALQKVSDQIQEAKEALNPPKTKTAFDKLMDILVKKADKVPFAPVKDTKAQVRDILGII